MTRSFVADEKVNRLRIFRDDDPPTFKPRVSPLHKHGYAEVHLIGAGSVECIVENVSYNLFSGDALIVPAGAYHRVDSHDERRIHFSFQAELPHIGVVKRHFSPEFIMDLFDRIASGDACIGALAYICTELSNIECYKAEVERDYRHAIGNFFDKRHAERVTVADLAEELHLSKMHTQRLVKKYTGMTFGENVTKYRLRVAEYLLKNSDMTKDEIARYVGYSSYSGFWKAKRREDVASSLENND